MPTEAFRVEEVLSTDRDATTGAITAQVGDALNERVEDSDCPVMQQWGFVSRPAKADAKKAGAEVVLLRSVDSDVAVAGRDLRSADIVGQLQEGEVCVYAPAGQAAVFFKEDGRISIYTTEDNTSSGRPVFYEVRPDGFSWEAPFGRMKVDGTGFHFRDHAGARIDVGALSAPPPLDAMGTYATIGASMVSLRGSQVSLGPDALDKDPVALTTPMLAFVQALTTFVSQLVSAVNDGLIAVGASSAASGPTGAGVFTSEVTSAVTALTTAAATLELALPSKSTSSA